MPLSKERKSEYNRGYWQKIRYPSTPVEANGYPKIPNSPNGRPLERVTGGLSGSGVVDSTPQVRREPDQAKLTALRKMVQAIESGKPSKRLPVQPESAFSITRVYGVPTVETNGQPGKVPLLDAGGEVIPWDD